jgi:hypothetical protein
MTSSRSRKPKPNNSRTVGERGFGSDWLTMRVVIDDARGQHFGRPLHCIRSTAALSTAALSTAALSTNAAPANTTRFQNHVHPAGVPLGALRARVAGSSCCRRAA